MRNLGLCGLGVLAVALTRPDSTQVEPFRRALTSVRSLLDFTMIVQYRSHTSETIDYIEEYTMRFHKTKDILLEFRVFKQMQAKPVELRMELRLHRNQLNQSVTQSKRWRVRDEDREEENHQRMELINTESNFNFIKMHVICDFHDQIYQFGNIPMYSTEFGELANNEQIKDWWRRSNKIDPARQIRNSYWR